MITYRIATQDDVPDLVRLRIEFLKEVMMVEEGGNEIRESLARYFREHLQAGDYINWLAVEGAQIVSTGGIYFYGLPPNFLNPSGNRAYILNVYTLPGYRRRGISMQLFDRLMQEGRDKNILQISLHATVEGRNLYEKFGFKQKANEMVWGKHI